MKASPSPVIGRAAYRMDWPTGAVHAGYGINCRNIPSDPNCTQPLRDARRPFRGHSRRARSHRFRCLHPSRGRSGAVGRAIASIAFADIGKLLLVHPFDDRAVARLCRCAAHRRIAGVIGQRRSGNERSDQSERATEQTSFHENPTPYLCGPFA
jgi:hypothetical protein